MRKHNPRRCIAKWNLAVTLSILITVTKVLWAQPATHTIVEQSKHVPVAYDVDVVVVGGSSATVAAACEARRSDASVFLISERPYVGVDLCAHQRLWLEPGEDYQKMGRTILEQYSQDVNGHFASYA